MEEKEPMKRFFVAVNLPDKVKEKIQDNFLQFIPEKGYKPVKKENMHVTLAFIGYVEAGKEKEIMEKLSMVKAKPFRLRLSGLGQFNYRVIWLGTTEGGEEMVELAKKVGEVLGIKEARFHSHFTLCRVRHPNKKETLGLVEKLNKKEFEETVEVKAFELMESKLRRTGPIYSVVKSFPLQE